VDVSHWAKTRIARCFFWQLWHQFARGDSAWGVSQDGYQTHLVGKLHMWPVRKLHGSAQAINLSDGNIALIYNDHPSSRINLTVAISEDDDRTFPFKRVIEDAQGIFSYPSIDQAPDGMLHVTYTYRRETIKHVGLDQEWVMSAAHAMGVSE